MMNWGINRIIVMSTVFVVGATLTAAILVSPVVTPMTASAFALDENMTGGENYTGGIMTSSSMAGSGVAIPPPTMTP
jgi:hypothetical protein